EWKYTEEYPVGRSGAVSKSGTDRTAIYATHALESQLALREVGFAELFFDPFQQLVRLQLLASAIERAKELGVHRTSVRHVAPRSSHSNLLGTGCARRSRPRLVPNSRSRWPRGNPCARATRSSSMRICSLRWVAS